jgi:hypothetical protein
MASSFAVSTGNAFKKISCVLGESPIRLSFPTNSSSRFFKADFNQRRYDWGWIFLAPEWHSRRGGVIGMENDWRQGQDRYPHVWHFSIFAANL